MKNIILEFFYNNLEPQEMSKELSAQLKKKLSNLSAIEDDLAAKIPDDLKELFNKYRDAYVEFASLSCSDSFISGFKYGARFTLDTFVD